jgi:hypothetical protein
MKAKILGFAATSGGGVTTGEDGKRYSFSQAEWHSKRSAQAARSGAEARSGSSRPPHQKICRQEAGSDTVYCDLPRASQSGRRFLWHSV